MFHDLPGLRVCAVDYKGVCNPSPPLVDLEAIGKGVKEKGGEGVKEKGWDDLKPVFYSKH